MMPLDPTLQQLAMADELLGKFPRGKTAPKTFLDYMRESPAVHGGAPSLKPSIRYKNKVYTANSHLDALDMAASEHNIASHLLAEHPELEYGYEINGQFVHDKNYISPWVRP